MVTLSKPVLACMRNCVTFDTYIRNIASVSALLTMISAILLFLFVLCFFIYHISKRKYDYWEKRNIPYTKPAPFLGNYGQYILLKKFMGQVAQSICQKFPDAPYVGAFYGTEPTLMVQDPEMIKRIMAKDYVYFNGREIAKYTHQETLTTNLFFTYGDRWKVLRQNLTPLFSSAKMKNMFYLIEKCAREFENMLDYEYSQNKVMKIRSLMARYTMDCIGSCVFGIETKTMEKDSEKNPFTIIGHELALETKTRGLRMIGRSIWPRIFYALRMKNFPSEIDNFFINLMSEVFASRNHKPTTRNDFVDLLLSLKNEKYITGDSIENIKGTSNKVSIEVDEELLVAQCALFYAAGYETSATTLHFTLYELAKNQDAQDLAIEEVDEYLKNHNNVVGYDCITEMPYVDACLNETLRLYPVLSVLTRETMEDYTLPCGAVIEKGVRVHLPVYHMHRHPDYFPEPEEYRPERFLGEAKRNIKPYTYFPFGEGPRICLGMRFSKMMMTPGLITVLKRYRVELAEPVKDLEYFSTTLVTHPKEEIKVKFVERHGWKDRLYAKV